MYVYIYIYGVMTKVIVVIVTRVFIDGVISGVTVTVAITNYF